MSKARRLEVPIGAGSESIKQWVESQLKAGVPRGVLYLALQRAPIQDDMDELETLQDLERQIGDVMVQRNLQGQTAEDSEQMYRAIELYEANVADRFDGSHPYERLRIIYASKGRFRDANRICEIYLWDVAADARLCQSYQGWIVKYGAKIEAMKNSSGR